MFSCLGWQSNFLNVLPFYCSHWCKDMKNQNNYKPIAWICAINQPNNQLNDEFTLARNQVIKQSISLSSNLENKINSVTQKMNQQPQRANNATMSTLLPVNPLLASLLIGLPFFPSQIQWKNMRIILSGYVKMAMENGRLDNSSVFAWITWWFFMAMLVYQRVICVWA